MELSTASIKPPKPSSLSLIKSPSPPPENIALLSFSLSDFDDTILTEILHRLATPQLVARCKAVCKRWKSLLSSPYYVARFLKLHARFSYYQSHSTVLLTYTSQVSRNPTIYVTTNPECYTALDLSFKSLPEREGMVKVVASCNDLLLLAGDKGMYVYNPFTRQSIAINLYSRGYIQYGLVAEPYYLRTGKNGDAEFELNDDFRFAVICFTEEIDMGCYVVDVYCPKSRKKTSNILSGEDKNYHFCSNVIACSWIAKLCWFNGSQVVVFDPFNPINQTFFIDASALSVPFNQIKFCDHCIGFTRGIMKIMQLVIYSYEDRESITVTIWRLEDFKTGIWSVEFRFNFQALMVMNPWLLSCMKADDFNPKILGFHPTDDGLIFMDIRNCVVLLGLRTLRLGILGRIFTSAASFYDHDSMFPLTQPWWPSPLEFNNSPAPDEKKGATFTSYAV